ncbi:MAG: flagellar basal body-associated protein FliL [Methylohalobius sp.]
MNQTSNYRKIGWLLVLLLAITPSLWAKQEAEKSPPSIEYLPLNPKLIVNLAGRHHYLRTDVQLMIKGKENLERIQHYLPVVRHTLITLLSDLPPEQVADVEEREKLRQEALAKVRQALNQYTDSEEIKDILFTEFLIQ